MDKGITAWTDMQVRDYALTYGALCRATAPATPPSRAPLTEAQARTVSCLDSWLLLDGLPAYSDLYGSSKPSAEDYSDMLRDIFFRYSAGGYNDDGGLVSVAKCKDKLEWIIKNQYECGQHATASVQAEPQWISVDDERKPPRGKPVLVAVSFVRYGEHEDGTPGEYNGVDVTEGEYVLSKDGNYFASFQGTHGDASHVTHWRELPAAPHPASEGEA